MLLPIVVAVLVLLLILFAVFFFRKAFRRPRSADLLNRDERMSSELFSYAEVLEPALAWFRAQAWEEVLLDAADGCRLKGLWLSGTGKNCLLLFHGYGGLPQNMCVIAREAAKRGWSLLLPYSRAHGESGGEYCSLGVLEAEDCCRWARLAADRCKGGRLVLYGAGMNGFAVLCTAGKELPPETAALVSEGAYGSPKKILRHMLRKELRMRTFPLLQLLLLFGHIVWKQSPGSVDLQGILQKHTALPILFIHGKKDRRVPCAMTEELYKAYGGKKALYLAENAGHAAASLSESDKFFGGLWKFLSPITKQT